MVRERQTSGRAPHRKTRAKQPAGSIWETPHLKQILSEPVGTPMELTREEAMAILEWHLENPRPYDANVQSY